jgi:hypothetical protein
LSEERIFPKTFSNASLVSLIKTALPEIVEKYGADANVSLVANLSNPVMNPFSLKMDQGIIYNSPFKASLVCTLPDGRQESADFGLNFTGLLNFTMSEFVLYPTILSFEASHVVIKKDQIGLASHDFTALFNQLIAKYSQNFNSQYSEGWPLTNISPEIGMLGGLLRNATITPYVSDGWMYGGFSMQADLPSESSTQSIAYSMI